MIPHADPIPAQDKACAFCGQPAQGHYAVHRDGFGVGPEADLCDACGQDEEPTLWDIWCQIAQPSEHSFAWRPVSELDADELAAWKASR